jgi:phycoerythrin-associated linker protein
MSLWTVTNSEPIELRPNATEDELQGVIRAVYQQVLGNAHLLEDDRLISAESLLRNGDITVRQFVSAVGLSDLYRNKFFAPNSQYRFVELNCKHFLGRAPQDQAELSAHVQCYANGGYDADISSYIDSDEYLQNFGENVVPYARGIKTQTGQTNVAFNRAFALMRGHATSDAGSASQLVSDLASNKATKIVASITGSGTYANTGKRFAITVATPGSGERYRRSTQVYTVSYSQFTNQVQTIQRRGGKIVSISEIG